MLSENFTTGRGIKTASLVSKAVGDRNGSEFISTTDNGYQPMTVNKQRRASESLVPQPVIYKESSTC
jgi:hypothetical protein